MNRYSVFLLVVAASLFAGCTKVDPKQNVLGIWRMHSINVNGMEVGDGKGFINFRADGRNEVRTGIGLYEYGFWEINPEKSEIVMKDDSSGATYQYRMWDDSLLLTMNRPTQVTALHCVKTDKYPLELASEGIGPEAFK